MTLAALDKPFKAFLGTTGAMAVAIVAEESVDPRIRLAAKVYLAGVTWLLPYLLKSKTEPTLPQPVNVVNPPSDPVNTTEQPS